MLFLLPVKLIVFVMEFFKILLLLLILSIHGFSQKETTTTTTTKPYTAKSPKGMKFIPPGQCSYNNGEGLETKSIMGFWMSNEITNKEFREFYEDIKANPDSS
ncbi:MAG: hypothetical protein PHH30_05910, partial [Bacteroidales bacterium]|nr:hypothetical protein [Bacteroidales bacterium]